MEFNNHGIQKSSLKKYEKEEKHIIGYVAEGTKKRLLKKGRVSTKHLAVFVKLYQRFVKARNFGRIVSYAWFYINANKINAELNPNAPHVPKSAAVCFIKQYNIKLRRVQ